MAIDTYFNVTIDPAANSKSDRADDVHIVKRGTANALNLTVAFDHTVVANVTTLRSALDAVVRAAQGGSELTQ